MSKPSNSKLIGLAVLVRCSLILYGTWQDMRLPVKFTDIDYEVFTDAARHVVTGGNPYDRDTFRYTPLLAYLMVPNIYWFKEFGKVLFAAADIAVAFLLLHRLRTRTAHAGSDTQGNETVAVSAWLFNPYTATISTRGNGDALVTLLQLSVLLVMQGRAVTRPRLKNDCHSAQGYDASGSSGIKDNGCIPTWTGTFTGDSVLGGLLFGLLVHWRVFPVIYGPSLICYIWHKTSQRKHRIWEWFKQCAAFGVSSLSLFLGLGYLFYRWYGNIFLQEAFLHHMSRHDPRHNFSPHFYFTYLYRFGAAANQGEGTIEVGDAAGTGAVSELQGWSDPGAYALPISLCVAVFLAARFGKHLDMCWLLTTITFVAFNKVCTAQYFVWYFGLLPLVFVDLRWEKRRLLAGAAAFWLFTQLHWLMWAYLLEFQGLPVFSQVWMSSLLFMAAHTWMVLAFMLAFSPSTASTVSGKKRV